MSLSARGAEVSIQALRLGAADCLLKPSGADASEQNAEFSRNLLQMVLTLGRVVIDGYRKTEQVVLRPQGIIQPAPRVVAIGSSTGGPNALAEVLPGLKGLSVPILITQHMPRTFTALLATHLEKTTGIRCQEAQDGMIVQSGHVYVAAGGFHMLAEKDGANVILRLNDGPPESFCKPAVDPMLRSLVDIYGARVLAVILTGMGSDGLAGGRSVVEAGGRIIAQDAATSVVWGMPGAVAQAGICSEVLPLSQVANRIVAAVSGMAMSTAMKEKKS